MMSEDFGEIADDHWCWKSELPNVLIVEV